MRMQHTVGVGVMFAIVQWGAVACNGGDSKDTTEDAATDDTDPTNTDTTDTDTTDTELIDTDTTGANISVDPSLFIDATVEEVACTLSDGTDTTCYSITTSSVPMDHSTGPWCPTNTSDGAEAGGIWPDGGVAYDVSGSFIANLATFYSDSTWQVSNADGSINYTETQAECEAAARPDVDPALQNHCVQCLPEYLEEDASYTYMIPKTPVFADTLQDIGGNIGVAFNGVEFAMAAPVDAILGAYTIAPFDDCGGHINTAAGYHYHAVTEVECLTRVAQADGHAGMIGYAMDGFAMHDMLNEDGSEPADLDGCRGHIDEVRGYHYHVTGPGENMILGCSAGLTVQAGGDGGGGEEPEVEMCEDPADTMCCGDGVCDGPETADNCPADCL